MLYEKYWKKHERYLPERVYNSGNVCFAFTQDQLPQQNRGTTEEGSATLSGVLGGSTSNPTVSIDCTTGHNDAAIDSSDWHIRFSIPDLRSFSHHVKDAVTTGVLTARARKEIIQVLRTYVTAYTIRPTSEQYTTVCRKLVERYPSLKDTKGKTKYVSLNNL